LLVLKFAVVVNDKIFVLVIIQCVSLMHGDSVCDALVRCK